MESDVTLESIALFSALARAVRDAPLEPRMKSRVFNAVEELAREVQRPGFGAQYAVLSALASADPTVHAVVHPYLPGLARLMH